MYWRILVDEKCGKKLQNPEHPKQKTNTCTGTGQAVQVHLVQKWAVCNLYRYRLCKTEKFQFLEKKSQNRNFGYEIVISVKNTEFILWISDDKMDFTFGFV